MLELLVVIAIIGVLSALIIPAISHMFEKARMVQCVNNLKQLHTAAANYANAHDGNLPFPASEDWLIVNSEGDSWGGHHTGWVDYFSDSDRKTYWWAGAIVTNNVTRGIQCIRKGSLLPYIGNNGDESVYVCPTMARLAKKDNTVVTRSYGMNASLQSTVEYAIKYFSIDGPSRIMLFAEQGFELQKGYQYSLKDISKSWNDKNLPGHPQSSDHGHYVYRKYRNYDGCIDWRHGGGVAKNGKNGNSFDSGNKKCEHIGEYHGGRGHAVFCDGHVERIKYDNTRYIGSGNWENHKAIVPKGSMDEW